MIPVVRRRGGIEMPHVLVLELRAGVSAVDQGITDSGYFQLRVAASGQCMEVKDGSFADNAPVVQKPCTGAWNQQWIHRTSGVSGWPHLVVRRSGTGLVIQSESLLNGAQAVQYRSAGTAPARCARWTGSDARGMRERHAVESRNVAVGDGLHLHVACAGAGPPLVLLHGFTGSTESWESLVGALDGYATIAVDLPGHGRSSAPADPARYSLDRFADDLAAALDTLGVDRAAVLGYSLGARAVLRFARAHPGRVAALVLESASPGIEDPSERAARVASDAALAGVIERDGVHAFVDRWERLPLWASQAALPEAARARLRAQRLTNHPRGLANSLRGAGAGADPSMVERVAAPNTPTLLVVGALDAKYMGIGRMMEAAMPGARLAVVPDAGHTVHLERLDVFAALVTDFLGGVPSANNAWR